MKAEIRLVADGQAYVRIVGSHKGRRGHLYAFQGPYPFDYAKEVVLPRVSERVRAQKWPRAGYGAYNERIDIARAILS